MGQVAQYAPLAVAVNGTPLQVQGGLKHLQVMVLQDLAPCCIVLAPIWNLHQDNGRQHNITVLQSNAHRQTIRSTAVSQALLLSIATSTHADRLSFGRPLQSTAMQQHDHCQIPA